MLKVVIIGYGEMFTNLIAGTLDAGCEIVGVYRKEMVKYSKFHRVLKDIFYPSLEYSYIKSYNLPEISIENGVNSDEFRKSLIKLNPDIILVGSWGEKFSKETFNIPKIATINAHPSLLPKYRGPNPYFWNIKNMEKKSGITFHLMDEGFDTGAILAQEEVNILPSDTGESLKRRTVLTARGVVCELLKDLSEDVKIPLQQREDRATYQSYPEDFELDFEKSADENLALIRACSNWYEPYFFHKNTAFIPDVNKTFIEVNNTDCKDVSSIIDFDYKTRTISVLCSDNKILKMSGLKLYKKYDRPFISNYIKLEVKKRDKLG